MYVEPLNLVFSTRSLSWPGAYPGSTAGWTVSPGDLPVSPPQLWGSKPCHHTWLSCQCWALNSSLQGKHFTHWPLVPAPFYILLENMKIILDQRSHKNKQMGWVFFFLPTIIGQPLTYIFTDRLEHKFESVHPTIWRRN